MNRPLAIAVLSILVVGIAVVVAYTLFMRPLTPEHLRHKGFLIRIATEIQETWPDTDARDVDQLREVLTELAAENDWLTVSWHKKNEDDRSGLMLVSPQGTTLTKVLVVQSNGAEGLSVTRQGLQEVDAHEVRANVGRGDLSVLGYAHHQ